jgi:hypothetical protein
LGEEIRRTDRERLIVRLLNSKYHLIKKETASIGLSTRHWRTRVRFSSRLSSMSKLDRQPVGRFEWGGPQYHALVRNIP